MKDICKHILIFLLSAGLGGAWAATSASTTAAPVRIDARTTQGAKVIAGTERVSPMAKAASSSSSSLTVDGASASGWSLSSPYYNSTQKVDGWHTFKLTESGGTTSASLLVLNGAAVHGGVLTSSETWDSSVVHVVRDWVRVPSGMELVIADGAIVKFCPGAGLLVDESGSLVLEECVLTHLADDARGGDTSLDGTASSPANNAYTLAINGSVTVDGDPELVYAKSCAQLPLYTLTTNGCEASRAQHVAGATVVVEAVFPEGYSVEDYSNIAWQSSVSGVTFTELDEVTAAFTMPKANATVTCVLTAKTYAINTVGCTADQDAAARGETVTVTANLPNGALSGDYGIAWSIAPALEFQTNGASISFTMPAEPVTVTCIATLKTYAVTVEAGSADKATAARGETVTVTAAVAADLVPEDYTYEWSAEPAVTFSGNGQTATFAMPASDVAVGYAMTLKTYAVTATGAVTDKAEAARGEPVTVTATLPEEALLSDYDLTWSSVPAVQFIEGEGTASFAMPAEAVTVTCVATLKTYAVTATGATVNKPAAARGETVTVTANLPEGALASDYEYAWSSVPSVQFAEGEGLATFTMPAEPVTVTCVATLKTYAVTVAAGTADKSMAARGETVTVTATVASDLVPEDYTYAWSAEPAVAFSGDGQSASFAMPAEAVAVSYAMTLKTYAVTANGAVTDKAEAPRGETVTVTATLPEEALLSDYELTWNSVPAVQFIEGEGTASFAMPAEAVTVTCVATLKTYAVTATGATANKPAAARGETVTVTANLPEGALASDYEYAWSSVPSVQFAEGEGLATFTMPAEPVAVTCVATLKTYAVKVAAGTADKSTAARGETVAVTATVAPDLVPEDYTYEWSATPSVAFSGSGQTATFAMPASDVAVSYAMTLKTYAVTATGAVADKAIAARGEMVTMTATLPEGALLSDYDLKWSSVPSVQFSEGEGSATFAMPAEAVTVTCVATLKYYDVSLTGATSKRARYARGETVTVTAALPSDAANCDYEVTWNFTPALEFAEDGYSASFEMPAEAVSVSCTYAKLPGRITVKGDCVANKERAVAGETVVLTPQLLPGTVISDYNVNWSSTPKVTFTATGKSDAGQMRFTMPGQNIKITFTNTLKTYTVQPYNCTPSKTLAARGEVVTVRATDTDFDLMTTMMTWTGKPAVEFTKVDEYTATFVMPAERVIVSAVKRVRTWPITTEGCVANKAEASAGTKITVTAVLPEGMELSDGSLAWVSEPALDFSVISDTMATFTMPSEAVNVTCVLMPTTYAVTANGAVADKGTASRGETVTVTATLPEGALTSDYEFAWSSVPAVQFTEGEGVASFTMPAEAVNVTCVATLKTYAVTASGATSDKSEAARGETVTVTAILPEGALASDYEYAWSSAPSVQFTESEGVATFMMPSEAVTVTCVATLKTYVVTTNGAVADKATAARGETVTVTATLPDGEEPELWAAVWSSEPSVEFAAADALSATFAMPSEAVSVSCELRERELEETATRRVLRLRPGWNAVVLSLTPDAESAAKLRGYPAMALDPLNHIYVQATEFSADRLYWLYATEARRVLVTGAAADGPALPSAGGKEWQPYGAFPTATLEGFVLWQWQEGAFRLTQPPTAEPGRGYFVK